MELAPCATMSRFTCAAEASSTMVMSRPSLLQCSVLRAAASPGGQFSGTKLVARAPVSSRRKFSSLRVSASKKTFSSFGELLEKSELPVLVDFYATWCGPCQYMAPVLAEVGSIMQGEITIVKIDSEKYPGLSSKYSIEALPTIMLFKDGKPIDRLEGALPADKLVARIRQVLESCKAGV